MLRRLLALVGDHDLCSSEGLDLEIRGSGDEVFRTLLVSLAGISEKCEIVPHVNAGSTVKNPAFIRTIIGRIRREGGDVLSTRLSASLICSSWCRIWRFLGSLLLFFLLFFGLLLGTAYLSLTG